MKQRGQGSSQTELSGQPKQPQAVVGTRFCRLDPHLWLALVFHQGMMSHEFGNVASDKPFVDVLSKTSRVLCGGGEKWWDRSCASTHWSEVMRSPRRHEINFGIWAGWCHPRGLVWTD